MDSSGDLQFLDLGLPRSMFNQNIVEQGCVVHWHYGIFPCLLRTKRDTTEWFFCQLPLDDMRDDEFSPHRGVAVAWQIAGTARNCHWWRATYQGEGAGNEGLHKVSVLTSLNRETDIDLTLWECLIDCHFRS